MLRRVPKVLRWFGVTAGVVLLTSITVDATLNNSLSQSALGILATNITETSCPSGTVEVRDTDGRFCIDQFEVSPAKSCAHPVVQGAEHTRINADDAACSAVSEKDVMPWTFVTFHQAQELCAKRGMRLPTNEEWYRAALGTPDPANGADCNVNSPEVSETLAYERCQSPSGAYDMIGNVWEWIDATVEDGQYENRTLPETGYVSDADGAGVAVATLPESSAPDFRDDYFWSAPSGSYGMMRGGFHGSRSDAGIYSIQSEVSRSFSGAAIGFRCVMSL